MLYLRNMYNNITKTRYGTVSKYRYIYLFQTIRRQGETKDKTRRGQNKQNRQEQIHEVEKVKGQQK
jgi:hypothetical protein